MLLCDTLLLFDWSTLFLARTLVCQIKRFENCVIMGIFVVWTILKENGIASVLSFSN